VVAVLAVLVVVVGLVVVLVVGLVRGPLPGAEDVPVSAYSFMVSSNVYRFYCVVKEKQDTNTKKNSEYQKQTPTPQDPHLLLLLGPCTSCRRLCIDPSRNPF
jgi:hypothetical protein